MPRGFREKLQKLTYMDFEGHDRYDAITLDLSDEELLSELGRAPTGDLYLGKYSIEEIEEMFRRYGIMDKLAKMDFSDIKIEIKTSDVYSHRLYVYTQVKDYDHMLVELRLREGWFAPKEHFVPKIELGSMRMILVDWLMLQNPRRNFDDKRPALPEQRYPGLGILQDLIPMVMEVVKETGRKGVLDVPEHYHGALFYSRWFRFYSPEIEGRFLAMQRDLSAHPLHLATHCIDKGALMNKSTGEYESWRPGEQILPLSDELDHYFNHKAYMEIRDKYFLESNYELDFDKYERMKELDEK